MHVRRPRSWLALLLATTLVLPALTAHAAAPAAHPDKIHARMQEAAERLKLTEAQKAELQPIVEDHVAKVRAIRAKYPPESATRDRRAMFDEMRGLRDDYDAKVRGILTPEQQKEWDKMRDEARARKRDELRERRVPGDSAASG